MWQDFLLFQGLIIFHLLIHSAVNGHLRCFHLLAIVSNAAVNVGVQISLWDPTCNSFRCIPESGIAGSKTSGSSCPWMHSFPYNHLTSFPYQPPISISCRMFFSLQINSTGQRTSSGLALAPVPSQRRMRTFHFQCLMPHSVLDVNRQMHSLSSTTFHPHRPFWHLQRAQTWSPRLPCSLDSHCHSPRTDPGSPSLCLC